MSFDYNSNKWRTKRKKILRLDKYRCQIMKMFGKTKEATIVHHIYPVKDYPQYAYETWNLISVSAEGHNKLEKRSTGELTALGKALKEKTKPGIDFRSPLK